jgi:hypothetical protein
VTDDEQHAKDVQDLRFLTQHFDEILDGMRQCYEGLKEQHNALVDSYNTTVGQCEALFKHVATQMDDFETRLHRLETGDFTEDPPI